ncbi:MAG: BamA/TamA family outer membrane protein [Bryobacteraceae bacterium]|jgi:Outer membrane protein/protective antigen OMA87|nr:BamA/TamA family outer membrane protein [Bryobacteraceae bacterium]
MERLAIVLSAVACLPAVAQTTTRAEEIQEERRRKQASLAPDETAGIERALQQIKEYKILERFTAGIAGFRLRLGGLATGSGFAIGPEYLRRDLADGKYTFRASTMLSTRSWYLQEVQFSAPHLLQDSAFFDLSAVHRNFGSLNYYGPGQDSRKTGRSNFRLEDTDFSATAGIRPFKNVVAAATGGYLLVNAGPGIDSRFASADQIYTEATTPGLTQQTNFLHAGGVLQYDYRDNPGGPRRGGNYFANFNYYLDRDLNQFSFRRLNLEAQQYFPFFHERRVIALRARSATTYAGSGQRVPFYLQPVLGGSDDLRGFRPFRFYGDNLLLMNAEYRWETFSGLDAALFFDAGKVYDRRSQLNLHDLETSYGFGLRANVRNNVFLRVDVGFSREGFQVWLKFNNVF